MQAIVLAATHERKSLVSGQEVPLPLFELTDEPYLTTLVKRLAAVSGITAVHVVTNDAIKPDLDGWAKQCPSVGIPVQVISDGTKTPQDRMGAVGDIIFTMEEVGIQSDLLIVGGDNWFSFDLSEFVDRAREKSPAMIVRRVSNAVSSRRFGWVRLDPEGRVLEFREHPDSDVEEGMLKASCVYFFAADDLKWFQAYAADHSTVCSPGTFLAWLAPRTPVYGDVKDAVFYDIGESRVLTGPDLLKYRDIVSRFIHPQHATWERQAARELSWTSSYEDLVEALDDSEPNKRIVAATLLGHVRDLLSEDGKEIVRRSLLKLLADPSTNEIGYGVGFGSDDESVVYASATAAESLVRLDFAETAEEVFDKAAQMGFPVEIRKNQY